MGVLMTMRRVIEISNDRFNGTSPESIIEANEFCKTLQSLLTAAPLQIEKQAGANLTIDERQKIQAGFAGFTIRIRKITQ